MATNTKTVCFTGHRPKDMFGYSESVRPLYSALCYRIMEQCQLLREASGVDTFISGGAQGVDQLAFWAVEKLKPAYGGQLRNLLYKPFEGQERRWASDGMFGCGEYAAMERRADGVHVTGDGENVVSDLMRRNEDMVDASDLVICVWNRDGKPGSTKGGTSACVRYALAQGKPVLVLDIRGRATVEELYEAPHYWLG